MPETYRLVVNLTKKSADALDDIMVDNEMSRTQAVAWALKYANEIRKLVGDGSLVIEKDGKQEHYRFV